MNLVDVLCDTCGIEVVKNTRFVNYIEMIQEQLAGVQLEPSANFAANGGEIIFSLFWGLSQPDPQAAVLHLASDGWYRWAILENGADYNPNQGGEGSMDSTGLPEVLVTYLVKHFPK